MICSRRRRAVPKWAATLSFALALVASGAARAGWTFCVADAGGGEIWISQVFVAPHNREHLESEFKAYLASRGVADSDVQCPAAKDDKTEMVNSQYTAIAFHHKLGDVLHEIELGDFAPRR